MLKISGELFYTIVRYNEESDKIDKTIMMKVPDGIKSLPQDVQNAINSKINNPLKEGTGEHEGEFFFKTHSVYPVDIFINKEKYLADDPEKQDEEVNEMIKNLGEGSQVEVAFKMSEVTFKGKKNQIAYLKALNIINAVDAVDYNPFE